MNFREVQSNRIRELAQTLKQNGLAASESEAIRMAESMTSTEDRLAEQYNNVRKDASASMIRNFDPNKRPEDRTQSQSQPSQQPREKEVVAQVEPTQAPVPTHSSKEPLNAINEAISNVQEQFKQQATPNPHQVSEIPAGTTLQEAIQEQPATQEAPMQQQPAQAPVQQVPMQEEQVQQPVETTQEQPSTQEASIVEERLPQPPSVSTPQEAPAAQAPVQEEMLTPQTQEAPVQQQPVETTQEQPAAQEAPNPVKEATSPVRQRPQRDVSHMAESTISLSDVFNVNK